MSETTESKHKALLRDISSGIESGKFVYVRNQLQTLSPAEVAFVLESSPPKSRDSIWQLIDADCQGEIIEELSDDVRNGILSQMMPESVAAATGSMDDDDLAEVLRSLPEDVYNEVLGSMDQQDRTRAERVLSYVEDTAGALMNTDTVTLRPDVNSDVVLRYLRMRGELPEATDYLYVVDDEDCLIGKIALTTLVTSRPDQSIESLMEVEVDQINVDTKDVDIAKLFERHNWVSAPVVDEQNHLLGRITIDDVVDIIREDAEHSMLTMAGLNDEEDTFAPVLSSAKKRSLWLGINLLTALLAMFVSSFFEDTLGQLAILAVLNTVVPSMGGVAGSQTLTLVIRGIALGHINPSNSKWLLWKEASVGLINGVLWAVLIATFIGVWKSDLHLGLVIAFAMLINMIAAGVAGVVIPILLRKLNIDPALAGGVILTTVTDIVGIFAFLGTATLFLL